jgi:hypothetical protein
MTAITLNGVDWTPSNYLPQDCIIDFVPRFREQMETFQETQEDNATEVTVFVEILNQEGLWKLTKDCEWAPFKAKVEEIADGVKWFATFRGSVWEDDSRTPEKNTKIKVMFDLSGGHPKVKFPVTHVTVRIVDREPFPLGLIRNKEWETLERCMNLVLKGWKWSATLRNQPWTNDDRKPCENDEIQIKLAKCEDTLQTVQVFVKVGSEGSQIVHLHVGRE